jgi:hypothetical protein
MTTAIPLSEREEPRPVRLFIRGREKPSREADRCSDCGEVLKLDDEDWCLSCLDPLCRFCFKWAKSCCPTCPSDPEEHDEGWWGALMEGGE